MILAAGAALADPLEGMWRTEVDDGSYALVLIVPCGAAFCGTIEHSFNAEGEYDSPNHGRQIVIDMVPGDAGEYAGSVWRPSNNKIYIGKINLDGDTLRLRGCVAGGLICSSQTWTREG
jgi:uncharacterized protein (DUF2147 family)